MKNLFFACALALYLPACSTLNPELPASVDVAGASSAADRAQAAINRANVDITAIATVVNSNEQSGIYTSEQAGRIRDKLREYALRVDQAQDALRIGNVGAAESQAAAARLLILTLRSELAKRSLP